MARKPDQPCAGCGKMLWTGTTSRAEPVCQDCRRETPRPYKPEAQTYQRKLDASRARRRLAKGAGQPWDGVSDEKIYERDAWLCQVPVCLCAEGRAIDPDPRRNDAWRRTIDHIVPLQIGGGDIESNKRAAHLACNARRSPSAEAWKTC